MHNYYAVIFPSDSLLLQKSLRFNSRLLCKSTSRLIGDKSPDTDIIGGAQINSNWRQLLPIACVR